MTQIVGPPSVMSAVHTIQSYCFDDKIWHFYFTQCRRHLWMFSANQPANRMRTTSTFVPSPSIHPMTKTAELPSLPSSSFRNCFWTCRPTPQTKDATSSSLPPFLPIPIERRDATLFLRHDIASWVLQAVPKINLLVQQIRSDVGIVVSIAASFGYVGISWCFVVVGTFCTKVVLSAFC